MPNNEIKEDLEKIYADVSEWLRFAETKHAAVLALWTALLVAVLSKEDLFGIDFTLYCIVILLLVVGSFLSIISFVPFLNKCKLITELCYRRSLKQGNATGNIVFYKNIFLLAGSPKTSMDIKIQNYKDQLVQVYGTLPTDGLMDSYIEQIISVSTVATVKFFWFDIVTRYLAVLVLFALVGIIIA